MFVIVCTFLHQIIMMVKIIDTFHVYLDAFHVYLDPFMFT